VAKAGVLRQMGDAPLVLLVTGLPLPGGAGTEALKAMTGPGKPVHAVVDILGPSALEHLRGLSRAGAVRPRR
jgi:uncharacterized protein (DUF1786 family)